MRRVLSTTLLGLAVAMGGEVARADRTTPAAPGKPAEPDAAATVQLLDYDTQTIRVPAGAKDVSVRYPFKVPKNPATIAVHVVSAMRRGEPSTDIGGRLTPEAIEDKSTHECALKLTLVLADPIEPGTYDVKVRFELPAVGGEAPEPLRATVKLVVPAADLHQPAKQIVELIDGRGVLPKLVLRVFASIPDHPPEHRATRCVPERGEGPRAHAQGRAPGGRDRVGRRAARGKHVR